MLNHHHPYSSRGYATSLFYAFLTILFPFMVIFSPRINLILTHARIDELIVFLFLPFSLQHFLRSEKGVFRNHRRTLLLPFLTLFILFTLGLIHGGEPENWTFQTVNQACRPLIVIANVLVLRYWILKSNIKFMYLLLGFIIAITLAGVLGLAAMTKPALALALQNIYVPNIAQYGDLYRFDMSTRAMSVFAGYDQASMTYAIAIIFSIFIFLNFNSLILKAFSILMSFCLLSAIVTSARIGFIAIIFAFVVIYVFNIKIKLGYTTMFICLAGAFLFILLTYNQLFLINDQTITRFADVLNLFDFSSPIPFWERSEGVNVVLRTQVYGIHYPQGLDMIWGIGDRGEFISDIGFIGTFVKYGFIGIAALLYIFISIGYMGYRIGKKAKGLYFYLPISSLLPGLMAMFIVGSMKGGLYFITYKIGELFAFILALSLVEAEALKSNYSFQKHFKLKNYVENK